MPQKKIEDILKESPNRKYYVKKTVRRSILQFIKAMREDPFSEQLQNTAETVATILPEFIKGQGLTESDIITQYAEFSKTEGKYSVNVSTSVITIDETNLIPYRIDMTIEYTTPKKMLTDDSVKKIVEMIANRLTTVEKVTETVKNVLSKILKTDKIYVKSIGHTIYGDRVIATER